MIKVISVEEGSAAARAGIRPGDRILAVNGREVEDFIDFQFHAAEQCLDLEIEGADGGREVVGLERNPGEALGIGFRQSPVRRCRNRCIFCFVDQLPRGLRDSLYVKDEDYRYSFLEGNFITGLNLREKDIARIIEMGLGPLYVSVHATDPEVRARMLGVSGGADVMTLLRRLTAAGIGVHAQVVLCPGINDRRVFEQTVCELEALGPRMLSVAVVPVGLTGHREGLAALEPVDSVLAADTLRRVHRMQRRFRRGERGGRFIFAADEFYLLAGRRLPAGYSYEGYPQIENGVGLLRGSIDSFRKLLAGDGPLPCDPSARSLLVSGELYAPVIESEFIPLLRESAAGSFETAGVPNSLLGGNVNVAGLLAGRDILKALESREPADYYLLPGSAVNRDGLFLDGLTLESVERRLAPGRVLAACDPAGALRMLAEAQGCDARA